MSWLKNLILVTLAVLAPVKGLLIGTGVILVIDLITGIMRAVKAKEKITSNGLRRTLTKAVAYELAIIAGLVLEKYLLDGSVPVIHIVAGMIALTEGKSVMENVSEITGVDFLKSVMDKLQGPTDEQK